MHPPMHPLAYPAPLPPLPLSAPDPGPTQGYRMAQVPRLPQLTYDIPPIAPPRANEESKTPARSLRRSSRLSAKPSPDHPPSPTPPAAPSATDDPSAKKSRYRETQCHGGGNKRFTRPVSRDLHWSNYPDCESHHINFVRGTSEEAEYRAAKKRRIRRETKPRKYLKYSTLEE
ncbi:hypothetical protein AURDEDRAFT_126916 [Auricularia subglabra TFB-10046 SS5]|nr:hypothetical protein AURDEDRAFT_126916 [Auricularia subglabra TFB-10046 SS5]